MDKLEEVKKLLWILDSKYNVSLPQTEENIDYIANEILKLFNVTVIDDTKDTEISDYHVCRYSKSMNQSYPRLCVLCGKPEFI